MSARWENEYRYDVIVRDAETVDDGLKISEITNRAVVIVAPTGKGKSTFVEKQILPLAKSHNAKIVLCGNRVASNLQVKARVAKLLGMENLCEELTPRGMVKHEDFGGNVRIFSYQKLEVIFTSCSKEAQLAIEFFREARFVIFDEAHFFTSDSEFNARTGLLLQQLRTISVNAQRIYMTATPDEIMPFLYAVEYKGLPTYGLSKLPVYRFRADWSPYKISYFNDESELLGKIASTPENEKWVLFVDNIAFGKHLLQSIGKDAAFLDATAKTEKDTTANSIWQQIVETEKFSARVLITTAIMENGINLKDSELKHIAIFSLRKTRFLQSLGRKRLLKNESVNLYLFNFSASYIQQFAHHNLELLSVIQECNRLALIRNSGTNPYWIWQRELAFRSKFYEDGSCENYKLAQRVIYFNGTFPVANYLAESVLKQNIEFAQDLLEKLKGDETAVIKEQLAWLGKENTFSEACWLNPCMDPDDAKSELIKFLTDCMGKSKSGETIDKFRSKFSNLSVEAFEEYKTYRKDRLPFGETMIRKILKKKKLPFRLSISGGEWKIERA